MGSIYRRGSRAQPRYYVHYRIGKKEDGSPRYEMRAAKGARTMEDARKQLAVIEARLSQGLPAVPEQQPLSSDLRPLLERWRDGLSNRNADDDRSRIDRHVITRFGELTIEKVTLAEIMNWLDDLKKTALSGQSRRHLLNLVSRFFSWAIERGLATVNPVKMIPQGKRPKPQRARDVAWLDDDSKLPPLMAELGPEVGLMLYLGNRSGLRTGEIAGLRMADVDFLHEGVIRVRYSWDGPLKEDKDGSGKVKWVPAPVDAGTVLKLHLAKRKLSGAKGEDLVFPFVPGKPQNRRRTSLWSGYRKEYIEDCWNDAAAKVGVQLTWYQATRHSFVSRNLKNGASLDEVSAALGHSSPLVTRTYYDHFVRKVFSPGLRQGITAPGRPANDP
ncbi:MAG TPA: site-specific integrase [Polyangiaceae bacterium]|nr:site-specific integrase [Polyangiaceae bacterium]